MSSLSSSSVSGGKQLPKVSVVLPAYNEESEICNAISEMRKQTYKNIEIIVVDDGSLDGTSQIARSCAAGDRRIRILTKDRRGGPAYARNVGIRESTGEVVFFGECDCVYDEDYVERAVNCLLSNEKAGAVCLTGAPLVTRDTWATRCLSFENFVQHELLSQKKIKPFYAWVYRREALERVGGFDDRLFQAEDRDLFQRVAKSGYEIAWVPGVHWRHKRNETIHKLAGEWIKRGRTRILYALKHRSLADLMKTVLPFWLLIFGVLSFFFFTPNFLVALVIVLLALSALMGNSLRMMYLGKKYPSLNKILVYYPAFVLSRNCCLAIGYSFGLLMFSIRKIQGVPITWRNI
jgi:glycosyltransferase involved in cell wall biosynthesis